MGNWRLTQFQSAFKRQENTKMNNGQARLLTHRRSSSEASLFCVSVVDYFFHVFSKILSTRFSPTLRQATLALVIFYKLTSINLLLNGKYSIEVHVFAYFKVKKGGLFKMTFYSLRVRCRNYLCALCFGPCFHGYGAYVTHAA